MVMLTVAIHSGVELPAAEETAVVEEVVNDHQAQ
jgi:hypothetical protein